MTWYSHGQDGSGSGVYQRHFQNVSETPVITSDGGGDTASISDIENTIAVTKVSATVPEAGPLTYSIAGGADQALFIIDGNTGALSFESAPDFEAPKDSGKDNIYDVTVKATDAAGFAATQALKVSVTMSTKPRR